MHMSEIHSYQHKNCRLKIGKGHRIVQLAMCFGVFRVSLVSSPFEEEEKGPGYKAISFTTSCIPKRIWRGEG